MARHPLKPDEGIAADEIAALRARIAAGQLQPEDLSRLDKLLALLLSLLQIIEQKKVTIKRLQRLLFGPRRDQPPPPVADDPPPAAPPAGTHTRPLPDTPVDKSDEKSGDTNGDTAGETAAPHEPAPPPRQKRQGHGRRAAAAYADAPVVHCPHVQLQAGAGCPLTGCRGHLHDTQRPQHFIRFIGHPPVTATRYEQQTLRCGHCQQRFAAELPAGVRPEKYDVTADVALVIHKYGALTPWSRQARVQQLCGLPLPETTQWERCEGVAEVLGPVWGQMQKAAAQAELLGTDDTGVQILAHEKAQQSLPKECQRATHTNAIVAQAGQRKIILLQNGARHAGERIAALLKLRAVTLPPPIQIGDALAHNWSHAGRVHGAKCWAHARRRFVDLAAYFPAPVQFVLACIGEVYRTEHKARALQVTPAERLTLHQLESAPLLLKLADWVATQWGHKLVEPNSALGKELRYLQNHWAGLTAFLSRPGVPLDNNAAENALRKPVLLRKNALFYKTEHGAAVGALLQSVLATCQANAVNAWEYLLAACRNPRAVQAKPDDWLPWRWAELQQAPSG